LSSDPGSEPPIGGRSGEIWIGEENGGRSSNKEIFEEYLRMLLAHMSARDTRGHLPLRAFIWRAGKTLEIDAIFWPP